MATPCPACGAERGHFYDCPIEGAPAVSAPPEAVAPLVEPDFPRARWLALPITLGAMLLVAFTPLRFVLAVLFGMWLHEAGHAAAAWLTGAPAVPLPWVTLGGHERSVLFIALELAALGAWLHFKRTHWRRVAGVAAALLLGLALPRSTADVFILFAGDGGALVLGTLLMLAVFLPDESRLSRGALRWGWLVIGAGAFASTVVTWLRAVRDRDEIPFGRIEGVGLSDPSRLVDEHGWTPAGLVRAYLALAAVCLLVLAVTFAVKRPRNR